MIVVIFDGLVSKNLRLTKRSKKLNKAVFEKI